MFTAHRNTLTRDQIYVSAVGDISADEIGPLLDDLLGGLPADGPSAITDVDFGLAGGVTVIPYDTPQSVALFGHGGIERDDKDFFAAYILNGILGGSGFESRLMTEVREERGLTYGIRSYLVPKFHAEMWIGQVASANATIAEAIEVTRNVWSDLAANGVTEEELAVTKTYLTGEYPLRFDGNAEIAGIMVGMQMIGLPPEYVINRNDYIEAVTLSDINRVAAEFMRPDDLHFVVVGQPVGLESTD
ncbi:MAG: zinc protease [Yoonia sp.]|jgi:zinc protease